MRQYSEDPALGEPMVMNYRLATLEPRQRAMLDFVVKLTEQSHRVTEADRQALRHNAFSDADIWDISEVAGFFNMTNRVAAAAAKTSRLRHVSGANPGELFAALDDAPAAAPGLDF